MSKWVDWDEWRERQRRLSSARQPYDRDHNSKGVYAHRPKPPRVGVADRDEGEADRADDRDEQNDPDREDEREDVDRA